MDPRRIQNFFFSRAIRSTDEYFCTCISYYVFIVNEIGELYLISDFRIEIKRTLLQFDLISGAGVAVINRRLYAVGGYDGVRRLDRWGLLIARIIIINKRLKMPGFWGKVWEGLLTWCGTRFNKAPILKAPFGKVYATDVWMLRIFNQRKVDSKLLHLAVTFPCLLEHFIKIRSEYKIVCTIDISAISKNDKFITCAIFFCCEL